MRGSVEQNSPAVEQLERQLMLSLKPVQPRTEFVDRLHTRLVTPSAMQLERRASTAFALLVVAVALLSGVFLILLLRLLRGNPADAAAA